MNLEDNRRIAKALRGIGIDAVERADAAGFLAQVTIEGGAIHYRADAPPSNLLHEAGHLACIPPEFRPMAEYDLSAATLAMGTAFEQRMADTGNPDDPLIRAILQCSDPEATAWAWAFGTRLGLPPETIIRDDEYDGDGAIVRLQVSTGHYYGVHGLRAAGMIGSVRDYPQLSKWVQDAT